MKFSIKVEVVVEVAVSVNADSVVVVVDDKVDIVMPEKETESDPTAGRG